MRRRRSSRRVFRVLLEYNITMSQIRNIILSKSERNEDMIARLIEDLVGRPIDEKTHKIIKEISNSENLILSTISKQLLEEY